MKKILLLTTLLVTSYNLFAFTTQGVWRWRNDDGSETTATWKADQNTPVTIYSTDSVIRLRIELYNNGSGGTLDNAVFEDSSNEVGSHWTRIYDTSEANAFKLAGSSPFVNDLEPTTHQLNGQPIPPYTFTAGKIIVITDSLPAQTLASGETSEFEYAFKPTSNIKPSVTYYFRVDAATYPIGYVYPSLTTNTVLAVNFSAFNLQQDKNGVQINWATVSEQNNNHFDIERSSNGSVFTKIATVKGNNNSTTANSYSVYDNKPLNGVNYYRLKQVDNDGKVTTSVIKSIDISGQRVIVKAYPNPTHGDVNFILQNNNGGVITATLTNVAGKVVHQEVIQTNSSVSNYKLNLTSKLPAGMYVLQLKGGSVTETVKISVQ
jgi:hypothetical protein